MPAFPRARRLALPAFAGLTLLAAGAPAAQAAKPLRGVTIATIGTQSQATVDKSLGQAKAAGAQMVRAELRWADVEVSGPGQYEPAALAAADHLVAAAQKRGLKVMLISVGTPCWASSAPPEVKGDCSTATQRQKSSTYGPTDPQQFARFAALVAGRYGTRLAGFEVWNEPDQRNRLYLAGADPVGEYAAILKAAYPAIKKAAPKLPVLGGTIVGADGAFLKALYAKGIKGSYDGLSVHYYDLILNSVKQIRAVQKAAGDKKPIWLGEVGWSSCAPKKLQEGQICVSKKVQGQNLADLYKAVARSSYVKALAIYSLHDSPQYNLGLYDAKGKRKPSFDALRKAWTAKRTPKLRATTLKVSRAGTKVRASGSGPAGHVYQIEVRIKGRLRYRANFRLSRTNTYSLVLPKQLGSRGLAVRVTRLWDSARVSRSLR